MFLRDYLFVSLTVFKSLMFPFCSLPFHCKVTETSSIPLEIWGSETQQRAHFNKLSYREDV